ncbi:MAG: formate C-acetyltransferase/glycerol dehydratase family glycyl radical enzyme, partial [Bacteroidetes bacterium]|nr:formate C-acetyltransferase/glycerol dehydratase family glycyl radical enzyme [Bacteroidota bacterium]
MTVRIKKLREQSTRTKPFISSERALLLTRFYQSLTAENNSAAVKRALAFQFLLENKQLCINEGELIVGERGPAPQAAPTYPEICVHFSEDLQVLHTREKIPFTSDTQTRQAFSDVIAPYWQGKAIRDIMFHELPEEWENSYRAGVFTEFMEQRPPGHTVLDDKIYKKGMNDFISEIDRSLKALDFCNDPDAFKKKEQLNAMKIAAQALIMFSGRYAEELQRLAGKETEPERKKELNQMAEICRFVPANAPRTFWEALQYYWFVHVAVITEVNPWDSFNPGRLDQHLLPFYRKEIAEGTLSVEKAKELLQSFWIKFNNHPAPPKIGVTAKESNTYTDFTLINP